ncbi:hypothetical protein [Mucilaginibacter sp. L3T2-6]|uniref:hypothetical protein n=1 Tax=Mucilaginibacter sp. L3T2-6 TaxID=3062491 RepID=UPI0026749205|nr:hypothetical protein [Mucilaginibacter sp. L3T2-6]MDO3644607.1 hypothetical protein [Mucilaginibacter sp. L3T2-6]MDV6217021.1 hypothetical protein [Mucilaginibacter sp. L3T2-6]
MKLIELANVPQMDTGAPSPTIIANDNNLYVTYNKMTSRSCVTEENVQKKNKILVVKFNNCLQFSFGLPSDETISGHRYYGLGLASYAVYELLNSDLIDELKHIEAVHPYFNNEKYETYKHYIITFHEKTFECVAEGYELQEKDESLYSTSGLILDQIF